MSEISPCPPSSTGGSAGFPLRCFPRRRSEHKIYYRPPPNPSSAKSVHYGHAVNYGEHPKQALPGGTSAGIRKAIIAVVDRATDPATVLYWYQGE
jgi:hypothetical protein